MPTTISLASSSPASWLLDEVEIKMQGVLDSMAYDTATDHNTQNTARRVAKMYSQRGAQWTLCASTEHHLNAEHLNELTIAIYITVRSACRSLLSGHRQGMRLACCPMKAPPTSLACPS
jgi:GTP cyclohydrolase I